MEATSNSPSEKTEPADRKSSRKQWIWLAICLLVGLILRLYHINNHGLFVDEVYSVLVSKGTGDPELIQFDAARPLYFILLKAWMMISSDEGWLRFFSVIFGCANIILIYLLGKKLAGGQSDGEKVGLAAAILTALSPLEIHYSQQVRMYTLGSFLAMAGSLTLLKVFETRKKSYVFAWSITRLLMVLTLPLTGVLLLVDGLYAFNQRQDKTMQPLLKLMAGGALLLLIIWSPFIRILLQAKASPYDSWRATLDIPDAVDFMTLLVNFTACAIPLQECGGPPCFDWFTTAYVVLFLPVLAVAIALCHKQEKMVWAMGWGLIPITAFFVYSNLAPPLFITRYTMFTGPFFLIVMAYGWVQIWTRWRPVGFGVAAVYALAMSSYLSFFYSHAVHEDWRPVGQYLTEHVKAGDEILVWNYHSKHLVGYYYHGQNRISDIKVVSKVDADDDGSLEKQKVLILMEINPKPGQRIWIISREAAPGWTRMHRAYALYQQALQEEFSVLSHENIAMTDIYEVQAKASKP